MRLAGAAVSRRGWIHDSPCKVIELGRQLTVASQRNRHTRVEGRRYGLVVAQERLVDGKADRLLNLRWRNREWLGRTIQEQPYALTRGSELANAVEQSLSVPHGGNVGRRNQADLVGRVETGDGRRAELRASVDDDVFGTGGPAIRNSSSMLLVSVLPGRSNRSEPARISRPDLCLTTSSRMNSLSRRCRLSSASSRV